MDRKKLRKIKGEIAAARRCPNTFRDLKAIATKLERVQLSGAAARGKEPTFVSTIFPSARPISIPNHGNHDLTPGTQKNILNDLDSDVMMFEEKLEKEEKPDVQENGGYSN